jgi:ABC-type polysaccharide/polyol phosphate transport system ATPase subunit
MLPEGTVHADGLYKRFRVDTKRWTLRTQLAYLAARQRGNPDAFWRWALRDINLHIEPGEAVGLVGPNGSGKSTLLKILSRVMRPYGGTAEVAGRIGAMIAVTAGIHAELSGRENIHIYGSILGLKREEVARRFDEIVEFAELGSAIDRQVKFYSSGMNMRLGFAVVAFLDPAVLLVDEVLAVGDSSFQQRCLDRMREVQNNGTTLVLVSHDLAAVESICNRCVFLLEGDLQADGPTREVLAQYRAWIESIAEPLDGVPGALRILKASVSAPDGNTPRSGEAAEIRLVLDNPKLQDAMVYVGVSEGPATPVFVSSHVEHLDVGRRAVECSVRFLPLPMGQFYLWVAVFDPDGKELLLPWQPAARFDVIGPKLVKAPAGIVRLSPVHVRAEWEIAEV